MNAESSAAAVAVKTPPATPVGQPAAPSGLRSVPRRVQVQLATWSGTTFDALRVRDYRLLFQGNGVTSFGYWMQQVAFGWLILELSGSPLYLGLAGFFRAIPMLVISPFGGVIADRVNRRVVILVTQVSQLVMTSTVAVLIFTGHIAVWHILLATAMHGISIAIQVPARSALIPQLVGRRRLTNALALYSMTMNLSRILGPTVAGILMGSVGVAWCLVVQSIGYVWALANVLQMRVPDPERVGVAGATVLQRLWEGLVFCYRTKPLRLQLLIAMVPTIFAMPYSTLLPAFARDVFHTGPSGLGMLYTGMGLGALTASVVLASRGNLPRKQLATVVCAASFGGFLVMFAMVSWLPLALLCLAAAGASSSLYMTLNSTVVQELTPDALRGRVSSLYMLVWGLMPLGSLPAGAIAEAWSAPLAVGLGGGLCLVFALGIILLRPQLRHANQPAASRRPTPSPAPRRTPAWQAVLARPGAVTVYAQDFAAVEPLITRLEGQGADVAVHLLDGSRNVSTAAAADCDLVVLDAGLSGPTALALYAHLRELDARPDRGPAPQPIVIVCPSDEVASLYCRKAPIGDYYAPRGAMLAWAQGGDR